MKNNNNNWCEWEQTNLNEIEGKDFNVERMISKKESIEIARRRRDYDEEFYIFIKSINRM